jgi:hypothetical protein
VSHFIRCDRCPTETHVLGTVSMPPGWIKVMGSDLCERLRRSRARFHSFPTG